MLYLASHDLIHSRCAQRRTIQKPTHHQLFHKFAFYHMRLYWKQSNYIGMFLDKPLCLSHLILATPISSLSLEPAGSGTVLPIGARCDICCTVAATQTKLSLKPMKKLKEVEKSPQCSSLLFFSGGNTVQLCWNCRQCRLQASADIIYKPAVASCVCHD